MKNIQSPEGKQKIIKELYDSFFNKAFPKMAERLGIVYTPVEVVDFIIRSVEDVLNNEFNASLADKGVQIIDPFTRRELSSPACCKVVLFHQKNCHKNITKFTPTKSCF